MDDATARGLADLRDRLGPHTPVAVLTGAGVSAASGIPTFRGAGPGPARCPACQALLRPGVVWFGEGIPTGAAEAAHRAVAACRVLLVIGTAGAVYPAAGLVSLASGRGAFVAEFNLERSAVSAHADLFVPGSAADTVPLFVGA